MAAPISQIPLRIKGQATCSQHKMKQLDWFCEKCQEPICSRCISSIHETHPICELSEITLQKEPDIKNFIERTEKNDLVQIGKYISATDTLFKENSSIFEKLSHKLTLQTDKLKQELDVLTAQTLSLYHRMEEDNANLIKKYKQDLEIWEKQLKHQIKECKTALQCGSQIQVYETFCDIDSPTYSLPVKPILGTANFIPNENPQDHLKKSLGKFITSDKGQVSTDQDRSVSTSDDLGQPSSQPQRPGTKEEKPLTIYTLLPQSKVVEEWVSPFASYSICPTVDGQVWTNFINTLTLLDRKGNVIQKVNHNVRINDISLSPTTRTLWVCDRQTNITELVSGQLIHRFSTKEVPKCICIATSNHVIVGMAKNISKFTTDGKMVCTTMATEKPHRISECPVTHNVAVAYFSCGRVVVMDTDFEELFVYRGNTPRTYKPTAQIFNPSGVVYDSVGNLIIGDSNNYRVLLISGGGASLFLSVIHTGCTLALGIDREDILWAVFSDWGLKVKLLQYISV